MRTKLLLIFTICFCGVLQLNAQFNAGRYLIGGGFNISNTTNSVPSQHQQVNYSNVNIQFGKIVKENTVAGVILYYGSNSNIYSDTTKSHNYGVGIFCRKYIKLARNLNFFSEVNAMYSHADNSYQNNSQSSKSVTDGVSASFVPGISYTICKAMQVELLMPDIITIGYSHNKIDYTIDTPPTPVSQKGNTFSISTNLNSNLLYSFGIGFKFLLGKPTGSNAH